MFLIYIKQTFKIVIAFVLILLFIRAFIAEPGRVNGRSMELTFLDEDFFVVNKFTLLFREPRRGDIVQFVDQKDKSVVIKRVIGLPGEKLSIKGGRVFLLQQNREWVELQESYLAPGIKTYSETQQDTVYLPVPEHSYFLMGDNRPMSGDSRIYGSVHRSAIYGLVIRPNF